MAEDSAFRWRVSCSCGVKMRTSVSVSDGGTCQFHMGRGDLQGQGRWGEAQCWEGRRGVWFGPCLQLEPLGVFISSEDCSLAVCWHMCWGHSELRGCRACSGAQRTGEGDC